jgi:PAS domain S-box-containing protein
MKEENEERFRALVQNSFDVITVFDYNGTITYQSDSLERVLGYTAPNRIGKNIFTDSIVHPDDREIEKNLFEKCIQTPYVYIRSEFRMKHATEDYKIMEVGCINLANNSSIHGIIQFYRDVTERRMLEKQKEEFIGVASHELKTPVTSIKAYTQILYEIFKEKEDEYSAELLLKMEGQIDRLSTLIKDLLDVTKITEGQLILKREKYDMNELIKEVAGEMQLTTKKHKIRLNLNEIPAVFGDKNKTSQVITNLVSNAIKYSPQANEVIVTSQSSDDEVTVCVQDFGIGISPEMQKKLFNRFFRVSDEVASTFSGLGLGLFISSEIVKNQDGRIWVESTPKEGATFCFSLPFK